MQSAISEGYIAIGIVGRRIMMQQSQPHTAVTQLGKGTGRAAAVLRWH